MTRCGVVTLAGRPNVGKSTLLNALVGEHLAIVSPKPQSSRVAVVGLLTTADVQFIFTDSPGLLQPEYRLQEAMRDTAWRAIADADVIAYLHPLTEHPAPPLFEAAGRRAPPANGEIPRPARASHASTVSPRAPRSLPTPRVPVVTVYTMADLVAGVRPALQPPDLAVSARTGEGLDDLLGTLRNHLPSGPFLYDPDDLAAQPMRFFAAELIREAAFELFHEELPYSVAVEIDEFREGSTPVYIRAIVYVERRSQKGIVIGQGGRSIKALGTAARLKIEPLIGRPVYLELHTKLLPKWRRHAPSIKRLGYAG